MSTNHQPEINVVADSIALAEQAAKRFVELANAAIAARGRFSVALSGGTTPRRMFELLAQPAFRDAIDWANVYVFWGDERFVAHDDPEYNAWVARTALLNHVALPPAQVYAVPTEGLTPESAAAAYAATLTDFFGGLPRFDLNLLGMGPDGHTASLFPGHPALAAAGDALVVAVYDSPKPPPTRITLTWRALNAARATLFLVGGADKAATVRAVLRGPFEPTRLPAQGIQPTDGTLTWLLDQAAAQQLDQ